MTAPIQRPDTESFLGDHELRIRRLEAIRPGVLPWMQVGSSGTQTVLANTSGKYASFNRWQLGGSDVFQPQATTNYIVILVPGVYVINQRCEYGGTGGGGVSPTNDFWHSYQTNPYPSNGYRWGFQFPLEYGSKVAGHYGFNYYQTSFTDTFFVSDEFAIGSGIVIEPIFSNGNNSTATLLITQTVVRVGAASTLSQHN